MNPFFPKNRKISNIVVAKDASDEIKESLKNMKFNIIETEEAEFLYDSVKCHPDIQIHPADFEKIFVAKNMFETYKEKFRNFNIELIPTENDLEGEYPKYTGLNIGRVSNFYIHNENYTDGKIKDVFEEKGIKNVFVKQGYSKCSTLTIGEKAVITSDRGIEKALSSVKEIEVYYVNPEGIELKGMNYGFIGGCGIMISDRDLLLTGRTYNMKDEKRFHEILNKYGINVIYLSDKGINDIGGFIIF